MENEKTIIENECEKCKKITKHNYDRNVRDGVATTITACRECGEIKVNIDPDI